MNLYGLLLAGTLSFSTIRAGELLQAVWDHDLEKIKKVLKQQPGAVNDADKNGMTALMYAVSDGNAEMVKLLIEAKADINAQDKRGDTALMHYVKNKINYTVQGKDKEAEAIKKLLLAMKADESLKNKEGKTWQELESASRLSIDSGAVRALELKKATEQAGLKKLIEAIREKNLSAVENIITADANIVNLADPDGVTPLMHVVGEAGTPRDYGEAMEHEPQYTYLKIAELLLKAGARPNAQDKVGKTAVYAAAEKQRTHGITLLSSYKADVNIPDKEGNTPLIVSPHANVTQALLAAGAKVDVQNQAGETALMRAVLENYGREVPMVTALIAAKADVNLKNKKGQTALDLARILKKDEVAAVLTKAVSRKSQ